MKKILLYLSLLAFAATALGCSPQAKWNREQKKAMNEALKAYRQMVNDTVEFYVITTIVDELNADAHNMRHLYPYQYLVSQGVLPEGLTHDQQKAFYQCFAQKVNAQYSTMDQFFAAILADTSDYSQLAQFQQQCANDLFDWEITEVEVIETN